MRFNGKPIKHWQKMADELVMYSLVRSITDYSGKHASLPQKLAAAQLEKIALSISPKLYGKIIKQRDSAHRNLAKVLNSIIRG